MSNETVLGLFFFSLKQLKLHVLHCSYASQQFAYQDIERLIPVDYKHHMLSQDPLHVDAPADAGDHGRSKQYSKGRVHGAYVRNAWASRQTADAQRVLQLSSDQSQNLAKAVFSRWARGRNSAFHTTQFLSVSLSTFLGVHLVFQTIIGFVFETGTWNAFHFQCTFQVRERFSFMEGANGELSWYKTTSNTYGKIQKAKNYVVGCHLLAQERNLEAWLLGARGEDCPHHVIVNRIFDDTNVWVEPEHHQDSYKTSQVDNGDLESEGSQAAVKRSKQKKKVSPLLGFLQKLCIRRRNQAVPEFVQLHVPAQVLPKARLFVENGNQSHNHGRTDNDLSSRSS